MKKKSISKWIIVCCALAGSIMFLMLLYFGFTENIEVYQERQNTGYQKIENYTFREIEDEAMPVGIKKEYTWILEETPRGDVCLAFYLSHQYAEVFIGEHEVYSLRTSAENRLSKTTGSNWVMIPLYPEDAGKQIRVITAPVYENYKNSTIDFLMGSQLQIWRLRLRNDLPQLILGIMAVFVGIIFAGAAFYKYIRSRHGKNLAYLGIFSIMIGLWRLTDTRSTPFFLPERPDVLFYVSVFMLMLGMMPLMYSMRKRFSEKTRLVLDGYCLTASILCLAQLLLQSFRIADLRETLLLTHVMIFTGCLILICCTLYERLKNGQSEPYHISRKFTLLCVGGVFADIISYYIRKTSSGLIFTLLVFLLYTVFSGIFILIDYGEKEKRLLEQEAALVSERTAILVSQIQPHFLFNSLIAIKLLCLQDAREAAEALDHFAGYLKGSMNSLKEKNCIRFESELNHVKNYLYLEQKRFGERLKVVYAIEEDDFHIPALTVQPMVENAVRHGICKKVEGGCVSVSACADGENWVIRVMDDGVGFDTEKLNGEDDACIGIKNVRSRLEILCGGRLEIKSVPGEGTTAVITIPGREEEV